MALTQDQLVSLANNPIRGVNTVVNDLETAWFDRAISQNSKSHPFIYATDLILGTGYGILNRVDDAIAKLFPAHARSTSDLSRHMSEEEQYGMFGNPSIVQLQFAILESVFLSLAKDVTVQSGKTSFTYKMLLLPKDTEVEFNGYTFAIENGIEIRYSEQTSYQVVYDDTTNNPIAPISTNLLKKALREINGNVYLTIVIPARQIACKPTENLTSNLSSGCNGTINFKDDLYGVRAFMTTNGVKREILVTYDQDVFNPSTVTLSINLNVSNGSFDYEIPDVYIANGSGIGVIDIYTYTTKGELTKDFTEVKLDEVGINYQDYRFGAGTLGPYSSALKNTGGVAWRAINGTTGGSNAKSFAQLKASFIQGRRQRVLPITQNNLTGTVENYGYDSVKTIDYTTGRKYSLTKELPIPDNSKFFAPMACFVGSYLCSVNNLIDSGVVIDNGQRITIPHNVLFDISKPSTVLVNAVIKASYAAKSNAALVDLVSDQTLVYTPFYYVMDLTNTQAVLRTYHLDEPVVNNQTFVTENSTLGIEVGVGQINIEQREGGYLVTLVTESGKSYKDLDDSQVGVQLSIQPEDSNSLASIGATYYGQTEGGERIWQFALDTNFDVDVNDVIYFTNFSQFGSVQPNTGTPLNLGMTFIFTMQGDSANTGTLSDQKIDPTLFTVPMVAIIETQYAVTLGQKLGNLYSRIRPLIGEAQYKRHTTPVPETYPATVLKRKENGELDLVDGKPVILHKAGDVMYTNTVPPQVILKYSIGDFVLDDEGQYVEVAPRDLQYHWDFIAFDGAYYFTKDDYDLEFAQQTKDYFVNHIGQDMDSFNSSLLDMTTLMYQPRNKMGYQKVVVNSNYQSYVKQDLGFVVTFYLTATGYKNVSLKDALTASTPQVINEALFGATTIDVSGLTKLLKDGTSSEVVSVKMSALAGDSSVDVISNADSLTGFCVRKLLQESSDGLLSIVEDIDIVFLPHDVSMVSLGPV
jgi:hypothetical protein